MCLRPTNLLLVSSVAGLIGSALADIDPKYAENITVYHLNPPDAGAIPLNMNTGDPAGDLLFYLLSFLLPLECSAKPVDYVSQFLCNNPELSGQLVVTKVDMMVDSRFTRYSACNLCNGSDPFSHRKCKVGSYECLGCSRILGCNRGMVGKEDAAAELASGPECGRTLESRCGRYKGGNSPKLCTACLAWNYHEIKENKCAMTSLLGFCQPGFSAPCGEGARDFECWRENVGRKVDGYWYSTLEEGECRETAPQKSCSWKVLSTSTVHEPCMKESMMSLAEGASPDCFAACGPRDSTSHCWIDCFFSTLLGPEANTSTRVAGLSLESIISGWTKPFLPVSEGGCPKVADIPMRAVPGAQIQLPGWLQFLDATQRFKDQMERLEDSANASSDGTVTI